ncbi:SDR family NAD(P)-dependent oxidoreductase [Clostridium sp. AF18-27]|uniref:SDR family NAD(P)-dependent oxidoreductase n=1 Tax=Enterocloster lavalensis TaxID=460384 RepID=UPI000E496E3C|nr:SDR family oxidoreductase [Enterocloster lavalensis]RHR48261.1 SDR family NAD(P)-dependent oxidoreductase [Clostridium sp. AF18-27]
MRTVEEMFRVDGKTALVTGGAGGIGLACAKALAAAGADLILSDIDGGRLDEAAEEIRRENGTSGGRCVTAVCDVADLRSVEKLLEQARDNGGVDILIHSAAVTNRKQLLDMTEEEWNHILTVNLNGAYHMGKQVGELMTRQGRGGKMTFIVSTGAYRAGVNFGAYSASKAGVVMMMKTLALELAPWGINVNAIAPTATETRFTEDYYRENPQARERARANHPLGRLARAEDYMGTALYLSSAASDFVTGALLVVDGGKTAK